MRIDISGRIYTSANIACLELLKELKTVQKDIDREGIYKVLRDLMCTMPADIHDDIKIRILNELPPAVPVTVKKNTIPTQDKKKSPRTRTQMTQDMIKRDRVKTVKETHKQEPLTFIIKVPKL